MPLLYSKTTGDVETVEWETIKQWQADGDPRATDYVPVPAMPDYNASTHNAPSFVNGSWVEVPKTAEELALLAEQAADAEEARQIKLVVTALKNGTGTNAERIARLERVCVQLIKRVIS